MSSIIDHPGEFTRRIATTSEYRRTRENENEPGENRRIAVELGAFTLENITKSKGGYDTKESSSYRLIRNISSFAESQAALDDLRQLSRQGEHITRRQREPYLRNVIQFNHAVKELVNQDPQITFSQLSNFTLNFYQSQCAYELSKLSPEDYHEQIVWFHKKFSGALNGMRHELGYEQLIGQLQCEKYDIEYDETDEDKELRGVDYTIMVEGSPVDVDVKASPRNVTKTHHVYSHLNSEDFGNGFRISPQTAQREAHYVLNDLLHIRANDRRLAYHH